jgi:hypothetical protein
MTAQRDRRQEILDRLWDLFKNLTVDLAGGPNGAVQIKPGNVVRNRNDLQADKVPGIIVLDADEIRDQRALQAPRGVQESRMPVQLMKMTPEIYIVLDVRGVTNENVGKDLNTARLAILNAIFTDQQLQDIVGSNGNITYDGCVTDLARNRTMKGQLGISVTFSYPLLVKEYVAG